LFGEIMEERIVLDWRGEWIGEESGLENGLERRE
jgi:hypothetical protein